MGVRTGGHGHRVWGRGGRRSCGRNHGHGRSAGRADAGVAIVATGGADGEPVGWAPVLALIEVALHVPSPTEGLAARRAPVGAAVNVTVVLKRARVFEDLAALVASVPAHAVWCDGKGLGYGVCKDKQICLYF